MFFCLVIGAGAAYWVYSYVTDVYRERAASYDMTLINQIEVPSVIYDRKEREIGRMFVENRSPINVEEIPIKMIDALVSGEDSRFWEHDGVDYMGILRAAILNYKSGNEDSGASTITMQLARNAYDLKGEALKRDESSYERKIVEIFLAQRIEQYYTKQEILGFYLNRVAFGSGYFGVRSASLGYFGKEPRDLEIQECASLVGCIKNPSTFSPLRSKKNNKKARDHVLTRMAIEGRISNKERDALQSMPVEVNPNPIERQTSHIYDRIAATVREYVSTEQLAVGGLRVFTSIDRDIQESMERKMREQLALAEKQEGYNHPLHQDFDRREGKRPKYLQGAALMYNYHNGEVIAYIGGRSFSHSQYDFIASGKKPLGTGFFPFVYTAAVESGYLMTHPMLDEAMDNRQVMVDGVEGILGEWGHEIDDPSYQGKIMLREGLAKSKIAATVRLGREVGIDKVRKVAKRYGLVTSNSEKLLPRELLGTESASLMEVASAYASFANHGKVASDLTWVTRIENSEGQAIYAHPKKSVAHKQVIHPATAYLIHSSLESALKEGSGKRGLEGSALLESSVAGKPGTTSDFADNWFAGYNSEVSCAVWSGFWDGSRKEIYPEAFSVDTVMPIWREGMEIYQKTYQPESIVRPPGIVELDVCRESGEKLTLDCEDYVRNPKTGKMETVRTSMKEIFYTKNRPEHHCHIHSRGLIASRALIVSGDMGLDDVQPVTAQAQTLLGDDPYGAEQNTLITASEGAVGSDATGAKVRVDQLPELDSQSLISVGEPKKLEILED